MTQRYLGIDGFRRGWVAAWIHSSGQCCFDYSPSLERLLSYGHTRAMIDIPVGIPRNGSRECDLQAQNVLGSVVFTGVRRNFWAFETQTQANQHYRIIGERGISAQLWGIRHKIKEVDDMMTPDLQNTILETHPELVFWNLNKNRQLPSKHRADGRHQRILILKANGFDDIDRWLSMRWGTGIGRDDLIDACACAIAARDAKRRIPEGAVPVDNKLLRMEMWY